MKDLVLLIDDEETILESLADTLSLSGFEVSTAQNGLEGLQRMEEKRPDIIICDIMMPGMDGYEFFNRIRSEPKWISIPFIFVSAKGKVDQIQKGYELGADHYITKPFKPEELLVLVNARLQRVKEIRRLLHRQIERQARPIYKELRSDLQEPIDLVHHYLEVYQKESARIEPQKADQISQVMRGTLDRMVKLIEDLMLITYIDSGAVQIEIQSLYQSMDLSVVLHEVIDHNGPVADAKGMSLIHFLPDSLPIHGHKHFTRDIFQRLLENAIKFNQPDGNIWIEASLLQESVQVSIRDEGMGISQKQQETLFNHIHDPERVKIERQGGGFGLAIASRLTRIHGGEMYVESVIGKGSKFTVVLPLSLGETL